MSVTVVLPINQIQGSKKKKKVRNNHQNTLHFKKQCPLDNQSFKVVDLTILWQQKDTTFNPETLQTNLHTSPLPTLFHWAQKTHILEVLETTMKFGENSLLSSSEIAKPLNIMYDV